ncbi:hypothetical protein ACNSOS_11095 [Aliarcobacter vitoriensis]|uniref:hypothetical protein n=1 Tax=Aliarcobacter vitoriensis TaxID=2011099 RepID=UPI003AABC5F3
MAIGNVMEKGNYVYIYDEKNQQTGMISIFPNNGDRLMGYTSSTINVKKGSYVYTYNEKAQQISMRSI